VFVVKHGENGKDTGRAVGEKFMNSFSRDSDFTFTTVFVVKHGENGKDAGRAVRENFMKTAVKKRKQKHVCDRRGSPQKFFFGEI
jgi:hypothetical protein